MKRMQQVLLNLLSNAIKYTGNENDIKIIVQYLNKSKIRVLVVDKGCGIEQKNKGKLFKLFASIKDEKR